MSFSTEWVETGAWFLISFGFHLSSTGSTEAGEAPMAAVRQFQRTFFLERRQGTWHVRRMFATDVISESSDLAAALEWAFERLRSAAPCSLSVVDRPSAQWELTEPSSEWKPGSRS